MSNITKAYAYDKSYDSRNQLFSRNVLIVGGGPAGLATALMLALRGWTNITVLEKRPDAGYYEPDKSFNYLIDGRGQKMTDFLGLTEQLSEISVPNTEFYLTRIEPNGSRKTLKVPLIDPSGKPPTGYHAEHLSCCYTPKSSRIGKTALLYYLTLSVFKSTRQPSITQRRKSSKLLLLKRTAV
jgi:choline dehydrogenase-like flavoprotein